MISVLRVPSATLRKGIKQVYILSLHVNVLVHLKEWKYTAITTSILSDVGFVDKIEKDGIVRRIFNIPENTKYSCFM